MADIFPVTNSRLPSGAKKGAVRNCSPADPLPGSNPSAEKKLSNVSNSSAVRAARTHVIPLIMSRWYNVAATRIWARTLRRRTTPPIENDREAATRSFQPLRMKADQFDAALSVFHNIRQRIQRSIQTHHQALRRIDRLATAQQNLAMIHILVI